MQVIKDNVASNNSYQTNYAIQYSVICSTIKHEPLKTFTSNYEYTFKVSAKAVNKIMTH